MSKPSPKPAAKNAGKPSRRAPRPERKARGLLAVGASLPSIAAPALRKRGFAQARLITDWPAIVGDVLARETVPQKLAFPRGSRTDAVLHLRVASGFALELQHIAPQLIDRINAFFGYRAVADLRYTQGPLPATHRPRRVAQPSVSDAERERLDALLSGISEPRLRAALSALGRTVADRPARR